LEKRKVGEIDHYYSQLGVAVVNLTAPLNVGDRISIETHSGKPVLEQTVDSMQIGRDKITEAKTGDAIGLKVAEKVHNGNVVYKI
jgi:putative protease